MYTKLITLYNKVETVWYEKDNKKMTNIKVPILFKIRNIATLIHILSKTFIDFCVI